MSFLNEKTIQPFCGRFVVGYAFAECDLSVCVYYRVYTWKLGLAEVVPSDERLHARACEQERHDRDEREPTAMQGNVT